MAPRPVALVIALAVTGVAQLSSSSSSPSSLGVSAMAAGAPLVHPNVHRALRQQGTANIIVRFKGKDPSAAALLASESRQFGSRQARIAAVVDQLQANAATSQRALDEMLAPSSAEDDNAERSGLFDETRRLWISNEAAFRGATAEFVARLRELETVEEVREERVLPLPPIVQGGAEGPGQTPKNDSNTTWGLTKLEVPDVWRKGFKGQGVVVGIIDTGALHTHEALEGNWRQEFGWFDPKAKKPEPYDDAGHGTHVTGTIAGGKGIGVAPGASWIACRGCTKQGCAEADLLACAEFMTCPTDVTGKTKDCSKAPHIVSNSWGGSDDGKAFEPVIAAWRAAGIIPVFAGGNSGPGCRTVLAPGDSAEVITIGATDAKDALARFSSRGPTARGLVKPDVSAPGVDIRSAWPTKPNAYNAISGTSMATPHVSGVVALLLSAKPGLDFAGVKAALTETARTESLVASSGPSCEAEGGDGNAFPNNHFGYGGVSAVRALEKVTGGGAPDQRPPRPSTPSPSCRVKSNH